MKPNRRYRDQPKSFWAYVRSISAACGYTARGTGKVLVPTIGDMRDGLAGLSLDPSVLGVAGTPTELGKLLSGYFAYRARVLNDRVEGLLMDADEASVVFEALRDELEPQCPLPMNKQKGAKRAHAYLTGIVNMLMEANSGDCGCDYDPRALSTVTVDGRAIRTLARRVDGAFPSTVNPVAIWEIKEYYYTTTFGSRVADGVYETLLDGLELEELREHEGINIEHVLMIDSHYTWWECGKSYLCRIVDMLHMGYVDHVLFGREVVDELPRLAKGWVRAAKQQSAQRPRR